MTRRRENNKIRMEILRLSLSSCQLPPRLKTGLGFYIETQKSADNYTDLVAYEVRSMSHHAMSSCLHDMLQSLATQGGRDPRRSSRGASLFAMSHLHVCYLLASSAVMLCAEPRYWVGLLVALACCIAGVQA